MSFILFSLFSRPQSYFKESVLSVTMIHIASRMLSADTSCCAFAKRIIGWCQTITGTVEVIFSTQTKTLFTKLKSTEAQRFLKTYDVKRFRNHRKMLKLPAGLGRGWGVGWLDVEGWWKGNENYFLKQIFVVYAPRSPWKLQNWIHNSQAIKW